MSSPTARKSPAHSAQEPADWGAELLRSPWLWGIGATVAFYQVLPSFESQQVFLQRYFCAHWTLYAVTGAFAVALAVLFRKSLGLIRDYQSLKVPVLANAELSSTTSATERAQCIDRATRLIPFGLQQSRLIGRVRDACRYILIRDTSRGLEGHLRHLAERAASRLTDSYSLVRTITCAMPILGILGTVIGIATAIAGFSPGAPLTDVTVGLAVAFDTTIVALSLSIILVFFAFIIEKCEESILGDVEQFGITELAPCFPVETGMTSNPIAVAEARAAEQILQGAESLVTWQTELWQSALENLRGRWMETADQQQHQFTRALQQGMNATLEDHQQQLADTRNELIGGYRLVTQELARVLDGVQQAASQQQQQFVSQVNKVWTQMQQELARTQSVHTDQTAQQATRLTEAIRLWHDDLAHVSESMTTQLVELRRQGDVLNSLTANEAEVIRLQSTLQKNLQSLRAVEAFEESIHSLNAAVHLLTARALPHAA